MKYVNQNKDLQPQQQSFLHDLNAFTEVDTDETNVRE